MENKKVKLLLGISVILIAGGVSFGAMHGKEMEQQILNGTNTYSFG